MIINRPDYIKRIKSFIGLEPVKVLTGLRRGEYVNRRLEHKRKGVRGV